MNAEGIKLKHNRRFSRIRVLGLKFWGFRFLAKPQLRNRAEVGGWGGVHRFPLPARNPQKACML